MFPLRMDQKIWLNRQNVRTGNRKVVGSTPVGRTRNFFFRECLCHSLKKKKKYIYIYIILKTTLGARGYFFREIGREIRASEARSAEKKKITSGHTYPEPHFRAVRPRLYGLGYPRQPSPSRQLYGAFIWSCEL